MENASKALMMAAGVLMGVLILSLAVYLIATFGASSAEIQESNEQKIISEFNAQFTVYEGRTDLTIHDIITVVNYAQENNNNYDLDESYRYNDSTLYISVKLGNSYIETWTTEVQSIKLETLGETKYKCKSVTISKNTGRVYEIIFTENN